MKSSLKVFYQNVFERLQTTGSIAPSSRYLAEAITRCVQPGQHPIRILEAGPGTGPFTDVLAEKLQKDDHLDLCELNDSFVAFLRNRIDTEPLFASRREQITLYHKPVQELEGEKSYDYIVSGLPFNNFPSELVAQILQTYQRLLKADGGLAFFEYAWVRPIKNVVVWGEEKKRVEAVGKVLDDFLNAHEKEQIFVPLNLPPSIVHVCRFD